MKESEAGAAAPEGVPLSSPPLAAAVPIPASVEPTARALEGHRLIAYLLRSGAILGAGLFGSSLVLELLPQNASVNVAIDLLRKAGGSVLLVTPVLRLTLAGGMLGARGEWRYALYAGAVLTLLGAAVAYGLAV